MTTETGIPSLESPFVQEDQRKPGAARRIAIPWYMLLVELWRRTGGGSGIAPTMVQTGVVQEYAGTTAPTGYLLCDGAAYLVADYPDLFAVIQYRFGGAGASFNVPDRRDRFAVGAGGAIAPNVGDTAGATSSNVAIAQANLPLYNLSVTDPGHNHTQNAHTHIQDAHNHTQNSHNHTQNLHNHTQDPHTHTQNAHTHTQNSHNHTQDAHNHTQNSHNHTQNAHEHFVFTNVSSSSGLVGPTEYAARQRAAGTAPDYNIQGTATGANVGLSNSVTATNQSTTATNQSTTATNQAATATNQNTTATNQNTTATNNDTTATNLATTATNIATTATNQNTTATNNANTTGISVSSAGGNDALAVPIIPPAIGMNFIIKT